MFCSVFSVNIAVNTLALTVNASRVLIPFCLRLKQYLIQFQIVINKIFNLRTENGNNNSIARRNQTKMKWSIFRNKIHKIAIIPKKVRYTCCFYNCLDGFVYFLISFLFHTRIGALSLPVVFFLFISIPSYLCRLPPLLSGYLFLDILSWMHTIQHWFNYYRTHTFIFALPPNKVYERHTHIYTHCRQPNGKHKVFPCAKFGNGELWVYARIVFVSHSLAQFDEILITLKLRLYFCQHNTDSDMNWVNWTNQVNGMLCYEMIVCLFKSWCAILSFEQPNKWKYSSGTYSDTSKNTWMCSHKTINKAFRFDVMTHLF